MKIQHEQTRTEESQEDLSAYVLHIKGQVVLAADKAKRRIQLEDKSIKSISEWGDKSNLDTSQKKIAARVKVDQILEKLSIRETGNEAYMSSLDSEMRQGGTMPTDQYLRLVVIAQELTRADRYLIEISQIDTNENRELAEDLAVVTEELTQAKERLTREQEKIQNDWDALSRQLPPVTSSAAPS